MDEAVSSNIAIAPTEAEENIGSVGICGYIVRLYIAMAAHQ